MGKSVTTEIERVLKDVKHRRIYSLNEWVKARTSVKDRQFWPAKIVEISLISGGYTLYKVKYPVSCFALIVAHSCLKLKWLINIDTFTAQDNGTIRWPDQYIQPNEVHLFLRKATHAEKKQ